MDKYLKYINEIEQLKKKFNLSAQQVFLLQIASAFEVENINYQKLKKEFCKDEN